MSPLNAEQLRELAAALPNWSYERGMLRREVESTSFPAAIELVNRIAQVAEEMNHHPDIDIRWRTLKIGLVTHSAAGITRLDVDLAKEIDLLAAR